MGLINSILPNVVNSPLGELVTALFQPARSIGPFYTQVTIEEIASDSLEITEHPVEFGAPVTDHAYKRPADVIIRCVFSNSSLASQITLAAGLFNLVTSGSVGPLNYSKLIYSQMLQLQTSRIPLTITTGKRSYSSMLIKSIMNHTDEKTENVLALTLHCKQIIIVNTQVTQAAVNSNGVTPTPKNGAVTNPVQQSGTLNLSPAQPTPGGATPYTEWVP